jgi:hypothetical protein
VKRTLIAALIVGLALFGQTAPGPIGNLTLTVGGVALTGITSLTLSAGTGTVVSCLPSPCAVSAGGALTVQVSANTAVVLSYPDAMAAAPFDCVSTSGTIASVCNLKVAPTVPPVFVALTTSVNCPGACSLNVSNTGIKAIKTNAAGATDATVMAGTHLLRYDGTVYRLLL